MPYDWTRLRRSRFAQARSRGRAMAKRRWSLDRQRRIHQAELALRCTPDQILRRIVVIDQERIVREAVIWSWDSYRSARRKLREVLTHPQSA